MISDIDTTSQTWRALERWALNEIEKSQKHLEFSGMNRADTEHVRGRIAALRSVLAIASPLVTPPQQGQPTKAGY